MTERTEQDRVDLSGVAPQRRETVRRRIAALEEYDGLRYRTSADLTRLCEPLGLSSPSFYRLWRSWRTLRDPVALQGGKAIRGIRDPVGDDGFVRGMIGSMPRDLSIEAQVLEIERIAAAGAVRVRSRSALRRLVRAIRAETTPLPLAASPEGTIGLDVLPIELSVDDGGIATLPLATIVLHPRTGSVLSALLSLDAPSPATIAAGLARWLDALPTGSGGTRVDSAVFPFARGPEWNDLWSVLGRYGIGRAEHEGIPALPGGVIEGAIGRRLLDFDIRPRMTRRPSEERRPLPRSTRLGGPIPLAEAQEAIDERVAAEARPDLYHPEAPSLASELRTMSGS
jgi:hypothetical protein